MVWRDWLFLLFFLLFFTTLTFSEDDSSSPKIVVVANSIDADLAAGLFEYFEDEGVDFVLASPLTLNVEHPFILFLGGHRAPGGVGDMVTGILGDNDKGFLLSSPNASTVFHRDGFFLDGQRVWVAAGFDRWATRAAWMRNKDQFVSFIRGDDGGGLAGIGRQGVVASVSEWYFADVIIFRGSSMAVLKDDPRFGKKFVIVNVTLTNYGNDTVVFSTRDFRVFSGRQSFGRARLKYLKASIKGKHIESGASVTGMVGFEVPDKFEDFEFVYSCPGVRCEQRIPLK